MKIGKSAILLLLTAHLHLASAHAISIIGDPIETVSVKGNTFISFTLKLKDGEEYPSQVTLTNQDTGEIYTNNKNQDNSYSFENIIDGTYLLSCSICNTPGVVTSTSKPEVLN